MPTRIDVAAKTAHKEINEIKNNIKSSLSTVGGGGSNPNHEEQQQLISPLFRDEVQHQEMHYLDGLLMEENKKSSEVDGKKKSELSSALQQQQHQSQTQYQSKLASILKPYDYKDDDEKKKLQQFDDKKSCSTSHDDIPQSQNDNSNKYFRVGAYSTNSKSTAASNQKKTIRSKVRGTLSNLIHRNSQTNKKNKQRQYGNSNNKKSQRKTATPSRNKRKSQLLNFKGTQKRIITKMIKIGRKCTRRFKSIKHSIENVVVQAIHKTHSMLEQHQHNNSNGVVDLSQRTMSGTRRYVKANQVATGEAINSTGKGSSTSHHKPSVKPNKAFYLTPNGFGC